MIYYYYIIVIIIIITNIIIIAQIDPATVKKLDSNLFLGNEITEVYKEIMKTVPTDHLNLENVTST